MLTKTNLFTYALGIFALLLTAFAGAQHTNEQEPAFSPMPSQTQVQANEDGVAIDGFDPVAYFDKGEAVKGLPIHSCEYLDKTWHFSSVENRDKFLANPEKFSPQYGGYCAHSIGKNKIVESNPQSFTVRDEKLYLYINDRLAKKDAEEEKTAFSFTNTVRDKNWLTFQSDF